MKIYWLKVLGWAILLIGFLGLAVSVMFVRPIVEMETKWFFRTFDPETNDTNKKVYHTYDRLYDTASAVVLQARRYKNLAYLAISISTILVGVNIFSICKARKKHKYK